LQKVGGLHSPLVSPRIGDITSIQALDLDPGFPQVTEEVYRFVAHQNIPNLGIYSTDEKFLHADQICKLSW
jgi:hypothetical protein